MSILFKQKLYRKTLDISGIRTRIVGVEVEHADHLTTNTAQLYLFNVWFSIYFRHSIFPSLSLCLPLSTYLSLMFDFLSFFISIFIFLCLVKNLYLFLQYLKFMYNFISFYLSLSYMHLYIYTSFSPLRHTQPQNKNKL